MALPSPRRVCEAWPIEWSDDISGVEQSIVDLAHTAAADVLWAVTGRQYGICSVVRAPAMLGTSELGGCAVRDNGQAIWVDGINPSVIDVYLDEEAIAQSEWLQRGRWLIRTDGTVWPQNTFSQPDRLAVHMNVGQSHPKIASLAVGELAYQIVLLLTDEVCNLPQRVQTLSRQGVSVTMISPEEFLDSGRIGLAWPDKLIQTTNPHGLGSPSRVISPDFQAWTPV